MEKSDSIFAMRNIRNMLDENRYLGDYCTINDFDDAVVSLFEEFEAFEPGPLKINKNDLKTPVGIKSLFVVLMNASWNLIHKHRNLMRSQEKSKEEHCKITNDNSGFQNQIKRLKETIKKKDGNLYEVQERERQLNVKLNKITRELKRQNDENAKLKKQLQSKDVQHVHELRRVQQNGNKLQDQLRRSVGTYSPRTSISQTLQTDQEKKINLYKKTISRLEENNSMMLQEINELRQALDLHSKGLELHIESSGCWDET